MVTEGTIDRITITNNRIDIIIIMVSIKIEIISNKDRDNTQEIMTIKRLKLAVKI
jgi:hypothetical protein